MPRLATTATAGYDRSCNSRFIEFIIKWEEVFSLFVGSLVVGYLKFGMGLLKLSGTLMTIVIIPLLICAVLLPRLLDLSKANRKLRIQAQREMSCAKGLSCS